MSVDEIFSRVVETETGCLVWQGARTGGPESGQRGGYAAGLIGGKWSLLHRVVWEAVRGPILQGLTVDHKCCVRGCLNVAHMQVVTPGENTRLGNRRRAWRKPVAEVFVGRSR